MGSMDENPTYTGPATLTLGDGRSGTVLIADHLIARDGGSVLLRGDSKPPA